jgi:Tfp pilus assembly protein PilN
MNITLELDSNQYKDLTRYCGLNKFIPEEIAKKSYLEGFTIEKYGLLGKTHNNGEKDLKTGGIQEKRVEIEVIREKLVEIPVEVIKEVIKIEYVEIPVEKRVEVPVEKIVERIVNVTDDTKINELLLKIQQLENRPPEIVEVVKEVPVDRVVEKIIYTTDDIQINELGGKIAKLENERQLFSTKTTEMENIFHNKMSKKDEELDELRRTLDEHLSKPPVEKIVELVVEKEITDNSLKSKLDALQNTLTKVRQETLEKDKKIKELEQTIQEIQKFQENKQAVYLKGSNLDDKLYK